MNRHGFDLRRIPANQIPTRFTGLLPTGAHIAGAATNFGDPAVARRGYMLTIVLDRTIAFGAAAVRADARADAGVFVDKNCLTFYHPFYTPTPPPNLQHLGPRKRIRVFRRFEAQARIDHQKSRFGYLVIRTLDALTRTR